MQPCEWYLLRLSAITIRIQTTKIGSTPSKFQKTDLGGILLGFVGPESTSEHPWLWESRGFSNPRFRRDYDSTSWITATNYSTEEMLRPLAPWWDHGTVAACVAPMLMELPGALGALGATAATAKSWVQSRQSRSVTASSSWRHPLWAFSARHLPVSSVQYGLVWNASTHLLHCKDDRIHTHCLCNNHHPWMKRNGRGCSGPVHASFALQIVERELPLGLVHKVLHHGLSPHSLPLQP